MAIISYSHCNENIDNANHDLAHEFVKQINSVHETIIMNVLRELLQREPKIEDGAFLTMIYQEDEMMNYDLAYLGEIIGRMEFHIMPPNARVTFIPKLKI